MVINHPNIKVTLDLFKIVYFYMSNPSLLLRGQGAEQDCGQQPTPLSPPPPPALLSVGGAPGRGHYVAIAKA
jgi:hypothetical protein